MKKLLVLPLLWSMSILGILPGLFAGGKPDKSGSLQLEFWTTDGQTERVKALSLLGDVWSAESGDEYNLVTVEESEIPSRLAAAISAGSKPDMVGFQFSYFLDSTVSGLLNKPAIQKTIEEIGTDRYGNILGQYKLPDGSYFAVPYYGWVQGIWYRKDLFAQAGLKEPRTWADIEKAASYFYKPAENQYGILIGSDPAINFTAQVFTQFALSNGAYLIQPDGSLGIDTPQMKEALKFYAKLAQYNPPGPQNWRGRDYYFQNRLPMFFYSTYILDDLALEDVAAGSLTGENFEDLKGASFDPNLAKKTGFVPVIEGPSGMKGSFGKNLGITIMDNGKARGEAASRFIVSMSEKDSYISYLHTAIGGMFPAIGDIATNAEFLNDPKGLYERYGSEMLATISNGLANAQAFDVYNGKAYPDAASILARLVVEQMVSKVVNEGESVERAIQWADAEARKVLGR